MCTFSPPQQRCYFISWLPNSQELIPAGADSVYIQRCSDKPYQPAQLKRSRARTEGPAPAQCQPHRGGMIFFLLLLLFFNFPPLPRGLWSEQGDVAIPSLLRVAIGWFLHPGAPGSYLGADNGEEEGTCPSSSRWEPAALSSEVSCPMPPSTQGGASPHPQLPQAAF